MVLYPGQEEIQGWIEWTRANLPDEGDIPYLDWSGPEVKTVSSDDVSSERENAGEEKPPWTVGITDFLDDVALGAEVGRLERMLDTFAQAMSADLLDLAPRFMALHFYYHLAAEGWPEWSMYNKDLYEPVQSAFRRDLRTLAGMLPPEGCTHDWRRIKWEISNALAGGDWDRARQIFKLAEAFHATEDKDLWALRGQFGFFAAFDKDTAKRFETHSWLLSVNPPDVWPGSPLALEVYGVSLVRVPKQILGGKLDPKMRETARDARNDLEKALHRRAGLGPPYHAMLGACHLALDDYAHAADEYNIVLNSETTFRRFMFLDFVRSVARQGGGEAELLKRIHEGDLSSFLKDFKPDLLQVLAKSQVLAGEREKAKAIYRQWAIEYPNDPQVYLHLAELFAQEPNYKEAYNALRKAVDLNPELEQELPYKVALPLGAIASEHLDLDRLTREAIKEHPEVEKLLDLLFPDVWPNYGKMSPEARKPWLLASVQTYYLPSILPASATQCRQVGAEKFAKAVEIELRQRVFEPFKTETSESLHVKAVIEQAKTDQKARLFAEYLVGKGRLALGQMAFILREARAGKGELFRLFGDRTRQHFSKLDGPQLEDLKKIYIPRNLESHESASLEVKEIPKLCRGFLDALLARSTEKAPTNR